jgi:oligosaccharide repeat unit polymerase
MAEMLVLVLIPATGHILEGRTVLVPTEDFGAGTTTAIEITAAAQWSMLAGAMLARATRPQPRLLRFRAQLSATRLDHTTYLALAIGALGLLLTVAAGKAHISEFLVFTSQSGYGSFAASAVGTTSGYFTAMEFVGGLALVLVALRYTSSAAGPRRLVPFLMIAASTVLLLGTGSRGRYLVPVLAAGIVWFKTTNRTIPPRRLFVAALLGALVLVGIVGVGRGAAGRRTFTPSTIVEQGIGGGELFGPLAGLAGVVPSQVPYLNGSSYLETLVFPIPRAIWHGKPTGKIAAVTHAFDPSDSGLAVPEFGEMYANFGFVGVVLGSILFAFLVERLWIRLATSTSVSDSVLVSVVFAVLAQLFARGAIAPILVTYLGVLLTVVVLCRSAVFTSVRSAVVPSRGATGPVVAGT